MADPAATPTDAVIALMSADRASALLGIELLDHGPGWATATMTVRADMTNGYGTAHGGVVFSLADTAFACACNSNERIAVAADCSIVFTVPARVGDTLVAHARERTLFGRSGLYDVTISRGDSVVAEFRGRSHQLREPPQ